MEADWALAGKNTLLWRRALLIQAIRRFFIDHGYLEVETPCLIPAPAPEVHIDALSCGNVFLQASPELCMKRLLAADFSRIFQICKCFRRDERGNRHLPEFTMLEWYRAECDYRDLMKECEDLLSFLFIGLGYEEFLIYQGKQITLCPPWERITVAEAFARYAPLSMSEALQNDRFDEMMACHIEPRLGMVTPTFVADYPIHPGALAKTKDGDDSLTERFELYLGGLELANAFTELTDAGEQRLRFLEAEQQRRAMGKIPYPPAERFLAALDSMPRAAGIALGIDRLAMIVTDSPSIDAVVAFTPEVL